MELEQHIQGTTVPATSLQGFQRQQIPTFHHTGLDGAFQCTRGQEVFGKEKMNGKKIKIAGLNNALDRSGVKHAEANTSKKKRTRLEM